MEAVYVLDVRKVERALMAQKLQAKSQAMSKNMSPKEIFQVRVIGSDRMAGDIGSRIGLRCHIKR